MRKLLSQPMVHFLLVGALLGAIAFWLAGDRTPPEETTIRLTSSDVARMEAEWAARWNRPPTPQELDGLVRANIRERILHREALRMGLDRDEPVVRRVLVQKLERITNDLIELSLSPSEMALEEYLHENPERYRPAPLVTFTQIFIDADRRGETAEGDAESLVASLRPLGEEAAGRALEFGDRFMLERHYPETTVQRIGSLFGTPFAEAVAELPVGSWEGPVASGYGLHAVFVHANEEFPVPELEEIRDRVRQDWVDETRREITDQYYDDLLSRYDVVIEGSEGSLDTGQASAAEDGALQSE